jgi:hypothetical protein
MRRIGAVLLASWWSAHCALALSSSRANGTGGKGGIRCSFLLNLLRNPTREFVIPGGGPIPEGSMLFKLGENGAWLPIQKR